MPDFVTLTCPSCGSRLQVTSDLERFACSYCGGEMVVRRSGGIVSLAPVVEGLNRVVAGVAQVSHGVDQTAAELAIQRLRQNLRDLEQAWDRVHGKKTRLHAWALVAFVVAAMASVNGSNQIVALAFVAGIGTLIAYAAKATSKGNRKRAIEEQAREVEGQIAYYQQKVRM